MGKGLERHLSKEDIQKDTEYLKRCLTLLITREMQIRTTIRYHLISIRMESIQKTKCHCFIIISVYHKIELFSYVNYVMIIIIQLLKCVLISL